MPWLSFILQLSATGYRGAPIYFVAQFNEYCAPEFRKISFTGAKHKGAAAASINCALSNRVL